MNLAARLKLSGIFIGMVLAIAFVIPTFAKAQTINVDVARETAQIEHNLGIGLNFLGDRPNVGQALQQLQPGTLRYATNEYYLFDRQAPQNPQVAIQDPSLWQVKSFTKPNGTWWNQLNFDRFMAVSRATNAEPFVVVGIDAIAYKGNAPHASSEAVLASAVDWVRYANRERGYRVKYWEIGNESNIIHHEKIQWTPEQYAQTVVKFARAMKAVDPSIKIGANGMRIKQDEDWWSRVMPIVKDDVDFLVTHQYSWQESYPVWKDATDLYDYNLQDAIAAISTYNPKLKLSVTENSAFNPSQTHTNNTWKMLHNFEMLGQSLSTQKVDYIHFWTSRWLEQDALAEDNSAFDTNYQLTPMGYALKVWNQFLKPKMVYTSSEIGTIASWASYDPQDNSLSIFLLNKDLAPQNVNINLNSYTGSKLGEFWVLKGASPESTDVSWSKFPLATLKRGRVKAKLEPLSVTVISLSAKVGG